MSDTNTSATTTDTTATNTTTTPLSNAVDNLNTLKIDEKDTVDADEAVSNIIKYSEGLNPNDQVSELEIMQNDKSSPLYAAKTFEELGLSDALLKGVHNLNYKKPSRIQEVSLPIVLGGKNLIGQAQSGTGKTACFVLGMLNRIDERIEAPQALCVCPTRELGRQILDVVAALGKFTNISYLFVGQALKFGRTDRIKQQVIVGTPGKVNDLITKGNLSLRDLKIFVLDEAELMLDQQGHMDDSRRIKQKLPRACQILLFSATFKDEVKRFALDFVPNPDIISVKRQDLAPDQIKQFYIDCRTEDNKFRILSEIYATLTIGQAIIFVNTREKAQELAGFMRKHGHTVSFLHGSGGTNSKYVLDINERDRIIDDFRKGNTKVLITTNVMARGIDVLQVSLVINFDLPMERNRADPETYLHRIGRTARFGRKGVAVNFVSDESSKQVLADIGRYISREITQAPADDLEALEKMIRPPY